MINLKNNFTLGEEVISDDSVTLIDMIWIEKGEYFTVNCGKRYLMNIKEGYWMSKYPITRYYWNLFVGVDNNLSKRQDFSENVPIDNISWLDAVQFCQKVNTFYNKQIPKNYTFRLPFEREWEFCYRANKETLEYDYKLQELDEWIDEKLYPVEYQELNEWGIAFNFGIAEFCNDTNSDKVQPNEDYSNEIGEMRKRIKVLRQGVHYKSMEGAIRNQFYREYTLDNLKKYFNGFRLCLGSTL